MQFLRSSMLLVIVAATYGLVQAAPTDQPTLDTSGDNLNAEGEPYLQIKVPSWIFPALAGEAKPGLPTDL